MGLIVITILLADFLYMLYAHVNFYRVFKHEEPDIYRNYTSINPIKHWHGFAWVDFALRRGYVQIGNPKLSKAGETLILAYDIHTKLIGYFFLIFTVGAFCWVLWFLFNQVT